jgi:hypothetical protein
MFILCMSHNTIGRNPKILIFFDFGEAGRSGETGRSGKFVILALRFYFSNGLVYFGEVVA